MRRFLLPLLVATVLVLLVGSPGRAGDDALVRMSRERTAWAARVAPAVVAVEARTNNGDRFYGAGAVVSADGLVLTAITAAPPRSLEIRVIRADGTSLTAKRIWTSPESETVLLRIKSTEDLPFLLLGNSAAVELGEPVFAVGNPHETLRRDGQTFVSCGTLTGRYVTSSDDRSSRYRGPVLETDASVNPGCDGGPLADSHGRLIGLLSLCYTRARWMGTAIPSERVLAGLPPHVRTQLTPRSEPKVKPNPIARVLHAAAQHVSDAVVRLEFDRKPEPQLATPDRSAPQAASVTQQQTGATAMSLRPHMPVTGVLIEPRGTVLTSALNLEGLKGNVTVVTADGRRFRAKPRGKHLDLDVAVLKLQGLKNNESLPTATLHASSVRTGSFVGVTGSPQHLHASPTFTTGIVSAPSRFDGLAVQIDARTNYGNAGGPVTDLSGRFLGIVTHVGTRKCWGQSSGVSFFAPAEQILQVLEDLRDGKVLHRPPQRMLGIRPSIGESDREGVKLRSIEKKSVAWRAGLREGDLITAADGQVTRSWSTLVRQLKGHEPGEQLRLHVLRDDEVKVLPVTLSTKE